MKRTIASAFLAAGLFTVGACADGDRGRDHDHDRDDHRHVTTTTQEEVRVGDRGHHASETTVETTRGY